MSSFTRDAVLCYVMCHDKRNNIWNSRVYIRLWRHLCKQAASSDGTKEDHDKKGSMERWKKEKMRKKSPCLSLYKWPRRKRTFRSSPSTGNSYPWLGSSRCSKAVCLLLKLFDFQFAKGRERKTEKETICYSFSKHSFTYSDLFFSRLQPLFNSPLRKNRW